MTISRKNPEEPKPSKTPSEFHEWDSFTENACFLKISKRYPRKDDFPAARKALHDLHADPHELWIIAKELDAHVKVALDGVPVECMRTLTKWLKDQNWRTKNDLFQQICLKMSEMAADKHVSHKQLAEIAAAGLGDLVIRGMCLELVAQFDPDRARAYAASTKATQETAPTAPASWYEPSNEG